MKRFLLLILIFLIVVAPAYSKKFKNSQKPVVVTFLSKDCDECDALDMVTQAIEEEYSNKVDFVNINIDEQDYACQKLKTKYNITSAPVIIFMNQDKKITKKISEYIPYNVYIKNIKSITE